ncbi:hypothetical protein RHMOL_Rhmol10G0169500 [Rhododendron molle]|uniref:Uncharacterized protein n=1 Tax=Rhododendron molle TaxID=49168 RepID=A0ACC0M4B3_RHOML|nr:hypothetical protein RHMOL_Rhmol10G0169500 [Rhododendron molle]
MGALPGYGTPKARLSSLKARYFDGEIGFLTHLFIAHCFPPIKLLVHHAYFNREIDNDLLPTELQTSQGGHGRGRGCGRGHGRRAPIEDEVSQHGENPSGNPGEDVGRGQGKEVLIIQNPFARDFVAALAAANLLNPAPRESTDSRALSAMREFSRRKPPTFDRLSSDPLVADHWLAQIQKLFRALRITKDDLRVNIVAVQLTGEANE